MKRLVTAICLLLLILGISCFSLYILERDLGELQQLALELRYQTPPEQLEEKSQQLFDRWNQKEELLVVFVRHDTLDQLTALLAELPSLARHGEHGHFYSEVDVTLARLDDLLDTARPTYRNLLKKKQLPLEVPTERQLFFWRTCQKHRKNSHIISCHFGHPSL